MITPSASLRHTAQTSHRKHTIGGHEQVNCTARVKEADTSRIRRVAEDVSERLPCPGDGLVPGRADMLLAIVDGLESSKFSLQHMIYIFHPIFSLRRAAMLLRAGRIGRESTSEHESNPNKFKLRTTSLRAKTAAADRYVIGPFPARDYIQLGCALRRVALSFSESTPSALRHDLSLSPL